MYRVGRFDFARKGPLSQDFLVVLLLYLVADAGRRGYRLLLESFWNDARKAGLPLPSEKPLSAPALCNARAKLSSDVFEHLLSSVTARFRDAFGGCRWEGRRVLATDGTWITTQRSDELARAFGVPSQGYCPQVLFTVLYDAVGLVPMAATVTGCNGSERAELAELLDHIEPGDVLVLDRGYPSFAVFRTLVDRGIDFLVRVPTTSTFEGVELLRQSPGKDYRVLLRDPKKHWPPLELRAVEIDVGGPEPLYFITSLRRSAYSRKQLATLYRLRWTEEEFFKAFKRAELSLGQMHAKSVNGVKQELFASLVYWAIARYLLAAAGEIHDVAHAQLSPKAGAIALGDTIVELLLATDHAAARPPILAVLDRLQTARIPYRPDRSYPRRSFKPQPKWGPKGRRGRDGG